nr:PREDICTED: chromosome partition protein Smc-like [Daucus carota subsp. sativus]
MHMDSVEKLNSVIKLTKAREEQVEKAMLSLLVEWKNLESLDSSTQQLLQDCFTNIQSRESQLNEVKQSVTARLSEVKQSVTSSSEVLNEVRNSLESRMKEVERREREVEGEKRRVEEKRREVECVFERFEMEKREREAIEERFEVVRLKEKSIESREVKLEAICGDLEEREKEVGRMREVIEKRSKEVEGMEEGFASKEREIEMLRKFTYEFCTRFNLQKEKFDLEKKEVEETVKELEMKEKCLKERIEMIDKREKEIDAKNVMSKERCKGVEIREKKLEDRLKQFELKEKRLKESMEAMDLKKKENELKNVSSEESCRRLEHREKKLEDQLKDLELKEKYFKEWVGDMEVKEKEINLKNALSEERCRKLQSREKKLDDQTKEFESKEKQFRERVKTNDIKKKEVDRGRILNEERCKKLDLMEKNHIELLTEFKLKEQQFEDRVKSFEKKEKEADSFRLSCEERCRKFELEKEREFQLKEKRFEEWVKNIDVKENGIDSVWILNEERCKKLDSMEKTVQELLTGLKLKEQHENRVKSIEAKEKEVDSIRISCEEKCRKFELEKKKLEDQIKESEMKKKQLCNVDLSIVKPEPCSVDGSYADIRFSITMGGKNLLLYLINQKRDLHSMSDEVFRVLRMSVDPVKLVLDAMQDFYLILENKEFESDVVCKSSNLLLEQLRRISTQIQPCLRKAAMELAHEWENKMKSSGEVTVFLNLLASYGLGTAFNPGEFLTLFEVIGQHKQISELCQLLGYTEKISDLIQVMLKEHQHVKAVKYVCAFGLRDKFKPASLLKELLKNSEEASKALCENSDCPIDKKEEAIDNIVVSLREALLCILCYKLDSECPPECIERFIKQLLQQKKDEKVKLSVSNNDAAMQGTDKNCNSATVLPDPSDDCNTQLKASCPILDSENALATVLSDMDGIRLLHFLNENSEDHELLGDDILFVLNSLMESAKFVLHAIKGIYAPHSEIGDKNFDSLVTMKSCILLLEQLMKQSPKIKKEVEADAMKLASDWKAKMRTPLQVLGFLHLICTYNLNSRFEVSELQRHFEYVSYLKHSHELCQVFRLSDKSLNQTKTSDSCHWHQKNSSGFNLSKKEDNNTGFMHSANLGKLVLDAICHCYYSNLKGKRILKPTVVKCFIILLEKLLTMSPQIQPHVRKRAAKFAVDWKVQLSDITSKNSGEVFVLFHLLAVYKVASSVDSNELLGLLDSIYTRRRMPELIRLLGLGHKVPDFVESLIQKGDRLQAIRYIYEFELVGKFLPVPVLKDHLSSKEVMKMSPANIGIISKQLGILRGLVKCIKDHQLEVEYPPEDLLAQIQNLEEKSKEVIERSQSYKNCSKRPHVSGPDPRPEAQSHTNFQKRPAAGLYPRPEAQTQWRISKHPRVEPPAGFSSNVPFPAFNPMANFARCEGAYMQSGPEAQRQWHINQLPQARPPGPSLYVQPPFHPMPNFLNTPPAFNPQNALQS